MRADDPALIAFAQDLGQEVLTEAEVEGVEAMRPEVFTRRLIETLVEAGEIEDALPAYHRDRGLEVAGYGIDDEDTLNLIATDYRGEVPPSSVTRTDVSTAFRRLETFWERCRERPYHEDLEESSDAHDMARHVHQAAPKIRRIRLFLVTDGLSAIEYLEPEQRDGIEVRRSIWDLARLHRLESSGRDREPIEVDLIARQGEPLPCLTAGAHGADYAAYLAVVPGPLLADIYEEHGARLLELNVRSFLQAAGKVNRGIRDSLVREPERFLAYNNGISATASEVDLVELPEGGMGIARIRDLQIVNGGQTTASIHRARGRHDLSDVGVQAKITVIDPERLDEVVPLISRYANTQNKVQEADLSANHPFHVAVESLSRSMWAPATGETLRQTRWFYERARGSYRDAQNRETTPARRKAFREVHPPSQRFTKTDIAKFVNTWDQLPHQVSRGAQKNFVVFMDRLGEQGDDAPDAEYFQRLVAKAILFRRAERIVTEQRFGGYRANIVTYALAKLSHATGKRVDLNAIWEAQSLPEPLEAALAELSHLAHQVIVERAPGGTNVTEWSKRSQCWTLLRETPWEPAVELLESVSARTRGGRSQRAEEGGRGDDGAIAEVAEFGAEPWLQLATWAKETDRLGLKERRLAYTMAVQLRRGRAPTAEQARQAKRILDLTRDLGYRTVELPQSPEPAGSRIDSEVPGLAAPGEGSQGPEARAEPTARVESTVSAPGGWSSEHASAADSSAAERSTSRRTPLDDVLSVRARNCLGRVGVHALEDLTNRTIEEIRTIPNLGTKSVSEIENAMREHGLAFANSSPQPVSPSKDLRDGRRSAATRGDEQTIVSMRELGMTLREIADSVGLSAERVRQILAATGRDLDSSYLSQVRREGRLEQARAQSDRIMERFRGGRSLVAIAEELGLDSASVGGVSEEKATEVDRAERRRNSGRGEREPSYSEEDLLEAIRTVARVVDRVPSTKDYQVRSPALGLPSLPTITNRFASWIAAVERAGMTPNAAVRTYTRTWDAEACRAALKRVVEELDRVPSVNHYEALARSREDLPSLATVRNRLGRWSEVTAELARERVGRPT